MDSDLPSASPPQPQRTPVSQLLNPDSSPASPQPTEVLPVVVQPSNNHKRRSKWLIVGIATILLVAAVIAKTLFYKSI